MSKKPSIAPNLPNLNWLQQPIQLIDNKAVKNAQKHQSQLTKPTGSLGVLEPLVCQLAGMQHTDKPQAENIHITTFAADHGITAQAVSAYPQSVTKQMVYNFVGGGAAISVLAKSLNANLEIVDVGVKDLAPIKGVISARAGNGSHDCSQENAMTVTELTRAFSAGKESIERINKKQCDIFIGGEIGIGNTTISSALCAKLLNGDISNLTDKGAGLDKKGVLNKITVIEKIVTLHQAKKDIFDILTGMGGFEIVALTGAYLRCAQLGIPILVGGFISSTAALCANKINPQVRNWMLFSHHADEKGHAIILDALNAKPLINLGMRLGEGSGATITLPLIQNACRLHNQMATFEQAAVSTAHT